MAKPIGDTLADLARALLKDPNTDTPANLTTDDIAQLRTVLNRLQADSGNNPNMNDGDSRLMAGREMLRL